MTITDSIEILKSLIQTCPDERVWLIHLTAHLEVRDGDPFNESRYCHANDRYVYRQARTEAECKLALEGR